jgi:cell division protein FtsB
MKRQENLTKKIVFILLAVFLFALLLWYRVFLLDIFFGFYTRHFTSNISTELSLSERGELEKLRVENETLKNDLDDLKSEINLMEDGLEPTYIRMISGGFGSGIASDFYGSFYVTYPKDKTVYKGMNIYSHGNVLVGNVEEVYKDSLFVTRLGQNKSFLAESSEVDEQLELSSLGSGLYVGNIAAGSKISVGDQVVLKGYPKAVVGTVSEITKNEGTFSLVYVRAPYNVFEKEIFYVLQ